MDLKLMYGGVESVLTGYADVDGSMGRIDVQSQDMLF
jgi:hypothetical protein